MSVLVSVGTSFRGCFGFGDNGLVTVHRIGGDGRYNARAEDRVYVFQVQRNGKTVAWVDRNGEQTQPANNVVNHATVEDYEKIIVKTLDMIEKKF